MIIKRRKRKDKKRRYDVVRMRYAQRNEIWLCFNVFYDRKHLQKIALENEVEKMRNIRKYFSVEH